MATKPPQAPSVVRKLVDRDVVQIEFLIEDLVKQLIPEGISPVASCNGCKGCRAAVDLADAAIQVQGRE